MALMHPLNFVLLCRIHKTYCTSLHMPQHLLQPRNLAPPSTPMSRHLHKIRARLALDDVALIKKGRFVAAYIIARAEGLPERAI